MTDAVDSMAYAKSGGVPWHGHGFATDDKQTPRQMCKKAKLDYTVSKREVFFRSKDGKGDVEIKDEYALVRDSDEAPLTMVGSGYKPVQPEEAIDFFKKFTEAGKMTMETAGSLWGGRYVWALARIKKDFTLGKTDKVNGYVLLASPYVFGKALLMQTTAVRVVCWNTLCFAVGADLRGKGENVFRMPHSTEFNDAMKKKAEIVVGLASEQMDEFKEAATLLSKKKVTEQKVEEFFCEVLRFDPKEATKKKDESIREPAMLPKFRLALEHSPGQNIATAMGTWWGALNAVTNVVDHHVGRDRSTALKAAWLGYNADLKRRAFDLAIDGAKGSKAA